jgi:hypothetical protein
LDVDVLGGEVTVLEVSSASASEVTSANVSEVSSASVSESEVSSLMTQSVTSPPKTSTSKEREITLPTSEYSNR